MFCGGYYQWECLVAAGKCPWFLNQVALMTYPVPLFPVFSLSYLRQVSSLQSPTPVTCQLLCAPISSSPSPLPLLILSHSHHNSLFPSPSPSLFHTLPFPQQLPQPQLQRQHNIRSHSNLACWKWTEKWRNSQQATESTSPRSSKSLISSDLKLSAMKRTDAPWSVLRYVLLNEDMCVHTYS